MRILFLGDMVGRVGREAVYNALPDLRKDLATDFVIVNGENAASGFGITRKIFHETIDAGADVVTSGNHAFDQKETLGWADEEHRFLRPVNFPKGTPGRGTDIFEAQNGARVLVSNIMGAVFMHPQLDDPFQAAERALEASPLGSVVDAAVVDFHAEATSESQCFGHFLDGQVSLVVGTHTHVPTSDHQILNGGTAYISDAGMCGDYDSSLGMDKEEPLNRFLSKVSKSRMQPATGEATVCGVLVVTDDSTGLATSIEPLRIGGRLQSFMPTI
ncbi:MAG: TIGR00282 family metallophosphoesterase [Pseudomonadota bacterium]